MRPFLLIGSLLLSTFFVANCSAPRFKSTAEPVDHALWDTLLRTYVDDEGLVDYRGWLSDTARLEDYLDLLRHNPPNPKTWTEAERMAYWINAYNAFTVELILDHYPVESIKDIKNGIPFVNTVWDIKFIEIGGETLDLNNIEHGILRKEFDDPRMHFALVCASMSCPKLQNHAYTADRLDEQLDEAAREFLREPFRNEVDGHPIRLSKILDWYWMDFKDTYATRYDLLDQYLPQPVDRSREIEFLDYDWSLNEQ